MLVNVYNKINRYDPDSLSWVTDWDMDNAETLEGHAVELNPKTVTELFSDNEFKYSKVIKIAVAKQVPLSSRVKVPAFGSYVFNIDNVQPRINYKGDIRGYNLICRIA